MIPPGGFGYISSAAGDEWTKRENEAAYKRLTIAPHYLSGYSSADRSIALLGTKISMPIVLSPMGAHGMAHATAEAGSAKGTDAAGTLYIAATPSNLSLEQIAQASPGPKWFQLYMPADRGAAAELLGRAKAANYRAIVFTIDTVGREQPRNRPPQSLPVAAPRRKFRRARTPPTAARDSKAISVGTTSSSSRKPPACPSC